MSKKQLLRTTDPYVFSLLEDKIENFNIGRTSKTSVKFICPRCGCIVYQKVENVIRSGLSCKRCGDGISFGEKFIFNVLEQLCVPFEVHVSYEWSDNRVYDIVVNENQVCKKTIIEVHGKQHYYGGFETYGGRTKEEEQKNDNYKMCLAYNNGYSADTYIVIDCTSSTLQYIKNSVLNNDFFLKFDLSNINWDSCFKNANSSYAMKSLDMWEDGYSVSDIANQLKLNRCTVRIYLRRFSDAGMCSYNEHEARRRGHSCSFVPSKPNIVACPELKLIFYSAQRADKYCELHSGAVSSVVRGKCKYNKSKKYNMNLTWVLVDSIEQANDMSLLEGYTIVGQPLLYTYNDYVA